MHEASYMRTLNYWQRNIGETAALPAKQANMNFLTWTMHQHNKHNEDMEVSGNNTICIDTELLLAGGYKPLPKGWCSEMFQTQQKYKKRTGSRQINIPPHTLSGSSVDGHTSKMDQLCSYYEYILPKYSYECYFSNIHPSINPLSSSYPGLGWGSRLRGPSP